MCREILIRAFTDKDREKGVVHTENDFNDGGERFTKSQ